MNEFVISQFLNRPLSTDELWDGMVSCRNALYSVFSTLPDRHANAFHAEYIAGFIEPRLVMPRGNPAVAAYRLIEHFLGFLAPPNKGWELPTLSMRKFKKDFFSELLEASDHTQGLPISAGAAMAPLVIQSLYLDALEFVIESTVDKPWTLWAYDGKTFKYPVGWYALTTNKSGYQYQVTAVTLATKSRLQKTLARF